MGPKPTLKWRAIGRSVIGASHVRAGMPNQDAIRLPETSGTLPLILAVSDGHGSARYFRSDRGARLAVGCATELIQEFLEGQPDWSNLSAIKRTADERLPRELVRRWKEAVAADLAKEPFRLEELEALEKKDGNRSRQSVEKNPPLAYGATLLIVLVTEAFILYLQLGDGDILTVSDQGEVSRPVPRDSRLFANQTTSLCSEDSWRDVLIRLQALVGDPPALILLSTDGYANSFVNEEAFLKVGSDMLEMIRVNGLEAVEADLEGWLSEASKSGSGDDITMGLICRADILPTGRAVQEKPAAVPQKPVEPEARPVEPPLVPAETAGPSAEVEPGDAAPPTDPALEDEPDGYPWMDPTMTRPPRIKRH